MFIFNKILLHTKFLNVKVLMTVLADVLLKKVYKQLCYSLKKTTKLTTLANQETYETKKSCLFYSEQPNVVQTLSITSHITKFKTYIRKLNFCLIFYSLLR